MFCAKCSVAMTKQTTYDFSVDVEQFLLMSWRCGRCDGVVEEITSRPAHGQGAPRRLRYAVRPWREPVGV